MSPLLRHALQLRHDAAIGLPRVSKRLVVKPETPAKDDEQER